MAGIQSKQLARKPLPAEVPEMRQLSYGSLSFEMDTFEAALVDGKAKVGVHEIPGTRMSWFAARDACEAAGKRLCTEQEWVAACQGQEPVDDDQDGQYADDMVEGNVYPYGEYHERGRCWDARNKETERPVYTGGNAGLRQC